MTSPRITSLMPGHRPPQVTIPTRILAGSKKMLRRGPAGSKPGRASAAQPLSATSRAVSWNSTRSSSAT